MARRNDHFAVVEELRARRKRHEVQRWADQRRQQDRLRSLVPLALDTLEEALQAGGPNAVKVALALVKLTDVAGVSATLPYMSFTMAGEDEVRAGLPPDDAIPALERGETDP